MDGSKVMTLSKMRSLHSFAGSSLSLLDVSETSSGALMAKCSEVVRPLRAPCPETTLMLYDGTDLVIRLLAHTESVLKDFILGTKPCLAKNVLDCHKITF